MSPCLAVLDGIPMSWSAPHPLHVAADEAEEALKSAEARFAAAAMILEQHPGSQAAVASEAQCRECLTAAQLARQQAVDATTGVLPMIMEHWFPVLQGLHGDTPFAAKLRRSVGIATPAGCPRCMLLGSKKQPNEDGSPGNVSIKATSYGGCGCKAQRHEPNLTADGKCDFFTHADFQYWADDGTFDKEAAELLLIDDELDDIIADAAIAATEEEMVKYVQAVNEGLAGLAPNASVQAKAKGVH